MATSLGPPPQTQRHSESPGDVFTAIFGDQIAASSGAIKLDRYLTQVRAVENQVANLITSTTCANPGAATLPQNFNPGATDMHAYCDVIANQQVKPKHSNPSVA